jgi:hypothetical protein
MRALARVAKPFAYSFLLLGGAAVLAGAGMTITINNNTTRKLLVTVYDLNTNPAQQVLASESINGFASVSVSIAADEVGQGHLAWTATTVDPDMRLCGHHDRPKLNDGDTVHVYANTGCAAK